MAKCRRGDAWSYGSLPARPEAGLECWAAGSGYPRRWVLQHWQPKRCRWGPCREQDAARAARAVLSETYAPSREEELRQTSSLSLGRPEADRRAALLAYYGFLAEREGALAGLAEF